MIDEHEWKSVLQIFQDGTISQASKHLFVSQPSLSQCIKKIESELGVQIFDRSTTPLQLTEAGRIYVDAAKKSEKYKNLSGDKLTISLSCVWAVGFKYIPLKNIQFHGIYFNGKQLVKNRDASKLFGRVQLFF